MVFHYQKGDTMKKVFSLLLVVMMLVSCFGLSGCGNSDDTTARTPEEKAKDCATVNLMAKVTASKLGSDNIKWKNCTYGSVRNINYEYLDDIDPDKTTMYKVSGTVSVVDDYGHTHTANYDVIVEYDKERDECDKKSMDIGTFTKE